MQTPSFQIDCWANDSIVSEQIYGALYDSLQGIQNVAVSVGTDTYYIMSAIEETQGQTLQDTIFLLASALSHFSRLSQKS